MKLYHIFKTLPLLALMALGAISCDYIHEDIEPCDHYLHFSYTYNMKQADAFVPEMSNQATAKQVETLRKNLPDYQARAFVRSMKALGATCAETVALVETLWKEEELE